MTLNKINATQKGIMVDFMTKHPDLAKNILPNSAQGRATSKKLWNELAQNLNAKGPPVKDAKAWRKTFCDQKYQLKCKMSFNKLSKKKTAGGPFEEMHLSQLDEQMLVASGLDVEIEGIPEGTFGASTNASQLVSNAAGCSFFEDRPDKYNNIFTPSESIASPSQVLNTSTDEIDNPTDSNVLCTSPEIFKRTYTNKKLALIKDKMKDKSSFYSSVFQKLDKQLKLQERNLRIHERILKMKEEKHSALMDLISLKRQYKELQLKKLENQ